MRNALAAWFIFVLVVLGVALSGCVFAPHGGDHPDGHHQHY